MALHWILCHRVVKSIAVNVLLKFQELFKYQWLGCQNSSQVNSFYKNLFLRHSHNSKPPPKSNFSTTPLFLLLLSIMKISFFPTPHDISSRCVPDQEFWGHFYDLYLNGRHTWICRESFNGQSDLKKLRLGSLAHNLFGLNQSFASTNQWNE